MPPSTVSSRKSSSYEFPDPAKSRNGKIPITPAVLRSIFASSRTAMEERTISRIAFFRFAGFVLSCIGISLVASRARIAK